MCLVADAPPPPQVFLREAQRQRLQSLLHQEVLRRIVALQRRFRAVLGRKRFLSMRRAASVLQVGGFYGIMLNVQVKEFIPTKSSSSFTGA